VGRVAVDPEEGLGVKVAYFINQYPKVSHSFIRREILALERQGLAIDRIALRGWDAAVPDADDARERERTHYLLRRGALGLVVPTLRIALGGPRRFIRALRLAVRMSRLAPSRPLAFHLVYLAEACALTVLCRRLGSRHVHAHFGTNSTEVVMLARALGGAGYSFTVHGPEEFMEAMGLEEKIRRAEFAVAISSYGRGQLYLRSPVEDWPKIHVVHCGLERDFHEVVPIPVPDVPRLVCVGRLCEAKGQLLLVQACGLLAAKQIPFELVLAGDGPIRDRIEQSIDACSLRGQVRITGWLSGSQVRDEILAARALVLPSFAEGLPVVLMEAMALRRPVLTTFIAGIPELVVHGQNGWLFPAGSIEMLEAALAECLSAPRELLQAYGDAGHRRVTQRHDIDIEARKLAQRFAAGR